MNNRHKNINAILAMIVISHCTNPPLGVRAASFPDAPLAQLDRALPSEAEGLNGLRRTGIEVRRFSELAKFGKPT